MRRLRMSLITIASLAMLSATTMTAATAQEEGPPVPPPGEPFAGILSGSVSFEPLGAPSDECPMGVRTVTDAVGPTTIGEVTLHAEHCPTFGIPSAPVGRQSLTTEGGDMIEGAYFIDCDPVVSTASSGEVITCHGRFLFTGGTGAFSEVSGSAYLTNFVWFPGSMEAQAWPWILELHGSISY